jgi:hypothetical protein
MTFPMKASSVKAQVQAICCWRKPLMSRYGHSMRKAGI